MARPGREGGPWWRNGRSKGWHTKIDGKTISLHLKDPHDHAGAAAAYQKLLDEQRQRHEASRARACASPGPTLADAAAGFLAHAERRHAAGRLSAAGLRNYRQFVKHLTADLGGRALASLTADDLEGWAARPGWSNSTQHNALGVVASVLKRAKVQLDRKVERPPMESRGADSCLSDDRFRTVLDNLYLKGGRAAGDLRELLRFLRETGFRPGEAARLTAEAVDFTTGAVTLAAHKRKRHTGTPETRHVSPAALAILATQRAKYGAGHLFRTRAGGKAYSPNVIVKQLLKVSERVGFRVTAYMFRHDFITHALVSGIPEAVVAALVGTSTQMIAKHYGHVGSQAAVLRAAAEQASRGRAG